MGSMKDLILKTQMNVTVAVAEKVSEYDNNNRISKNKNIGSLCRRRQS
jgi:hypothetical protein